jgi:hypothetical protein
VSRLSAHDVRIEDVAKQARSGVPDPATRIACALETIALEASAIRVLVRKNMQATERLAAMIASDLEEVYGDDDDTV